MNRFVPTIIVVTCALGAAELPVREVILFKHGVGFFLRNPEQREGDSGVNAKTIPG
jgi:hypothetical protein